MVCFSQKYHNPIFSWSLLLLKYQLFRLQKVRRRQTSKASHWQRARERKWIGRPWTPPVPGASYEPSDLSENQEISDNLRFRSHSTTISRVKSYEVSHASIIVYFLFRPTNSWLVAKIFCTVKLIGSNSIYRSHRGVQFFTYKN